MRAAALIALMMMALCPPARAQQNVPAVQADKLIDRLYPGKSKEIERRLGTTATLTATPLATSKPAATPAPLILRIRRSPSGDGHTSPRLSVRPTTRTLTAPAQVARRDRTATRTLVTTTTTIRNRTGQTASEGDLQAYLGSLKQTPAPVVSPAAAGKKPTVAVPVDKLGPAVVNINRASQQELESALGIDPQRARLIIEFRASQGRIKGPDDLAHVNGITADMIIKWEKRATLSYE